MQYRWKYYPEWFDGSLVTSRWRFVKSYQIAEEGIWMGPNRELLRVPHSLGETVLYHVYLVLGRTAKTISGNILFPLDLLDI